MTIWLNSEVKMSSEVNELHRIGLLVRHHRKKKLNPVQKIARQAGLTQSDWFKLENGQLKIPFSTLTKIFEILQIPLDKAFNSKRTDFFPFITMAMGKNPTEIESHEIDEVYDLYLDLIEFRRKKLLEKEGRSKK